MNIIWPCKYSLCRHRSEIVILSIEKNQQTGKMSCMHYTHKSVEIEGMICNEYFWKLPAFLTQINWINLN